MTAMWRRVLVGVARLMNYYCMHDRWTLTCNRSQQHVYSILLGSHQLGAWHRTSCHDRGCTVPPCRMSTCDTGHRAQWPHGHLRRNNTNCQHMHTIVTTIIVRAQINSAPSGYYIVQQPVTTSHSKVQLLNIST